MSSVREQPVSVGRPLPQALGEVRRRIRAYVAVEGLALTIAAAGAAFWIALALDWMFEPPRWFRLAILGGGMAATLYVFARRFLSRVFAKLADRSVALLLERRFRSLNEALLTSVELNAETLPDVGRSMLGAARREAERQLATARIDALFDVRPRRRAMASASATVGAIVVFAAAFPSLFRLGVDRISARTDELWPRRTSLSILGFDDGERVIAQGADLELTVRADTTKHVPDKVYLRFRSDDGLREEQLMDQEGIARPGVDPFQPYKYVFHGVSSSMTLDVIGDDARLRGLRVRVVERPQIVMRLSCAYPEYTRRESGEIAVTGTVPLPQGTIVTVSAEANKPLRRVTVGRADGGGSTTDVIDLAAAGEPSPNFRYDLGRLDADMQVTFDLYDDDGIDNRATLSLQAVVDSAPVIGVARKALETSVTPQARVPLVGKITDDYGLARLWFEYAVDNSELRETPFAAQPAGARESVVAEALELPQLFASPKPLEPGQTLAVVPKAQDGRNLPGAPQGNVAAGDTVTLSVVSDADMLRLLEAREIMFREQFKALIEKVTRDRNALVGLGDAKPEPAGENSADGGRPIDRNQVLADQIRSHGKGNRAETLVVADGFGSIVEELSNNRVADSERLRERLSNDVAAPLRRIGDRLFADYENRLTALQRALQRTTVDRVELETTRREALRSADEILVEMNVVLSKMLELESFKEAVDLLRSIIALQKDIGEQTKKQRSSKLRLLQD